MAFDRFAAVVLTEIVKGDRRRKCRGDALNEHEMYLELIFGAKTNVDKEKDCVEQKKHCMANNPKTLCISGLKPGLAGPGGSGRRSF